MSNHSFNPIIAKTYGIIEAILIDSFIFWTRTNFAKDSNFHNGRYWVFGTPEYFAKYYPYLTERQIKYALKKLVDSDTLLKNNFNKKGYDKTNWYSLSDKILTELNLDKTCLNPAPGLIGQNCPIDRTKLSDGQDKIVQPIPDTKPDTKPDNIYITREDEFSPKELKPIEYQETLYPIKKAGTELTTSIHFKEFWNLYPKKTNELRAHAIWVDRNLDSIKHLILHKLKAQIEHDSQWMDGYIPNACNYLSDERWNDEVVRKPQKTKKEKIDWHSTEWANDITDMFN